MFRTKILIASAVAFFVALWLGLAALVRLAACAFSSQWPSALKFGLVAVASGACVLLAAAIFLRTFRSEVAEREADRARHSDKDAPPWAQQ